MKLEEVTVLMGWIQDHRIDQYVKIDALTDAILDLFEKQALIEDVPASLLNTEEEITNG